MTVARHFLALLWAVVGLCLFPLGQVVRAGDLAPRDVYFVALTPEFETTSQLLALFGREIPLRAAHRAAIEAAQDHAKFTQEPVVNRLKNLENQGTVEILRSFWVANTIAIRCDEATAQLIGIWPEVEAVLADDIIATLPFSRPIEDGRNPLDDGASQALIDIRAPEAWSLGLTGVGVLVGNFDSGVNANHPGLAPRWRGNSGYPAGQCWFDLVEPITSTPGDNDGHGSLTMGLQCGMIPGDTVGVAWNAQFIAAAVAEGGLTIMNALAAFEWVIDPDGNPATFEDMPRVLSNSWGSSGGQDICASVLYPALDLCQAAGMAIVWSAGNEGPAASTMRSPAVRADSPVSGFSVGGWDTVTDSVWISSSRGPTPCTTDSILRIKPEIVAPSRDVRSTYLGSAFASSSGTSFSAPLSAGVLALMIEANPLLPPDSLLELLMLTTVDIAEPGLDNNSGYGRIDALFACRAALTGLGWVEGYVHDPWGGVLNATINVLDHPHSTVTNNQGEFYNCLPAFEPFDLQIVATGFQPQVLSVSTLPHDTTLLDIILQPTQQGLLTGNVIDCRGQPANGAFVRILELPDPPTLTDANGRFLLTLNPGTYTVACSSSVCDQTTLPGIQIVAGAITDIEIVLPLNPAFLCSGADNFGYHLCDNFDPGGPTDAYLSTDPVAGGRGVVHNLADDGTAPLQLPFPVRFYGVDYSRVYLNANGIVSFVRQLTSFNNIQLPYNQAPALFPFWDDQSDNLGGSILSDYDPARGTFTLEWSNVPYFVSVPPPTDSLSYQVVFYDQDLLPTASGNSVVEFRYGRIGHNTSATIGIDQAAGNFVRYGFNGVWETHAVPVAQNVSVRIADQDLQSGAASLALDPPSLLLSLAVGDSVDTTIVVRNLGSVPMSYAVQTSLPAPTAVWPPMSLEPPLDWAKGEPPSRWQSHDQIFDEWVPDSNGYAWRNSLSDTSVHHEFFDISTLGANLGLARDDTISMPRPLPFQFPFYGRVFSSYGACSNGFLSFWSQARSYINDPLTLARDPYYVIAPFWTDLYPPSGGQIFDYYDATRDRFIVQWNDIVPYGHFPWETLTFQVVLYRNGGIDLVYENMSAVVSLKTVGIKGGLPGELLQLSYNGTLVDSSMTLRIARPDTAQASVRVLSGFSGVVAPAGEAPVAIRIRNNGASQGNFPLPLYVSSSDPDETSVAFSVNVEAGTPFDPATVIRFDNNSLALHWRRHPMNSFTVWSALPGDSLFTRVVPAIADTHYALPLPGEEMRFYVVTLTGAPVPTYGENAFDPSAKPTQTLAH